MKKILILSLLVVAMPFLGFPIVWENKIYIALGLLIFVQSVYLLVRKNVVVKNKEDKLNNNTYTENGDCPINEKE